MFVFTKKCQPGCSEAGLDASSSVSFGQAPLRRSEHTTVTEPARWNEAMRKLPAEAVDMLLTNFSSIAPGEKTTVDKLKLAEVTIDSLLTADKVDEFRDAVTDTVALVDDVLALPDQSWWTPELASLLLRSIKYGLLAVDNIENEAFRKECDQISDELDKALVQALSQRRSR